MHPLAGQPAPDEYLDNIPRLIADYYTITPDPENLSQRVAFGTSGHRGSASDATFNEFHILAISQAICEYRKQHHIGGPLFIGMDTHALSEPALISAIEVFSANDVELMVSKNREYTPTPVISHAIVCYNRSHSRQADGVVITPSHNPPGDGGFKYNPPHGGPAGTDITRWVEHRANDLIANNLRDIKRTPFSKAMHSHNVTEYDYMTPYVDDLDNVIDLQAIAQAKLHIGVDPLGGSGIHYWEPIADKYQLNLELANKQVDPTFSFMHLDKDGKIRMDCSSASAMAGLIAMKDRYDIAFGNDPDFDRHGIVVPHSGLMNPNHYLAVAIDYLLRHRPSWPTTTRIGKTVVTSAMIDRVAKGQNRNIEETPVGFKWFVEGLNNGTLGFGGEESAGASFLRKNGTTWTTDKDGFIMTLLAAELTAVTGKNPQQYYETLAERYGNPAYQRLEAPADSQQKKLLLSLTPEQVPSDVLAGEPILEKITQAPGSGASIGGLKVITENSWFAARPSGTEAIYKIYVESFRGEKHLNAVQNEAQALINEIFKTSK
ncbi:Phosphoglucomutase [invertebrate metagenome]|uniref:Phosphoglucomutase n=1 Tax=invertebrate metagenome TaxID=1711999 RepID=A0A2H9T8A4_9ZZZZ